MLIDDRHPLMTRPFFAFPPNLFTVTGPGSPSVFTNMIPSIEQHCEWITACIEAMRGQGKAEIEPTPEAEADWVAHNLDVAGAHLRSSCASWYTGANIAGKPKVFMPYIGGFPRYVDRCEEIAANGYEGFRVGRYWQNLSATPDVQRMLGEVIRQHDGRRQQVQVEAIIVEISDTAAQQLGVQLFLSGLQGSNIPFAVTNYSNIAPNANLIAGAIGESGAQIPPTLAPVPLATCSPFFVIVIAMRRRSRPSSRRAGLPSTNRPEPALSATRSATAWRSGCTPVSTRTPATTNTRRRAVRNALI